MHLYDDDDCSGAFRDPYVENNMEFCLGRQQDELGFYIFGPILNSNHVKFNVLSVLRDKKVGMVLDTCMSAIFNKIVCQVRTAFLFFRKINKFVSSLASLDLLILQLIIKEIKIKNYNIILLESN